MNKSAKTIGAIAFISAILFLNYGFQDNKSETFAKGSMDIGLVVSDLQKSIDFYVNVIGMTITSTGTVFTDEESEKMGFSDGLAFNVTGLRLVEGSHNTMLKLISCGKKFDETFPEYVLDGRRLQYMTIHVTSMKPVLEKMDEYNIDLLGESPITYGEDYQYVLIRDPDGTFVELLGPRQ